MNQAAHVPPAPSRCHAVCFLPPLRSGPVECGIGRSTPDRVAIPWSDPTGPFYDPTAQTPADIAPAFEPTPEIAPTTDPYVEQYPIVSDIGLREYLM